MSLQKLENFSNKTVVQEEVQILTDLLEDITKNMLPAETFDKIIQLKELSSKLDYQGLDKVVTSLSNDEMVYISRYFSILPLISQKTLTWHLRLTILTMLIRIILVSYQQLSKW